MFADDFVTALSASGVNISADSVPTQDTLNDDLTQLQSWLESLDGDTHQAIDQATAGNPIKAGLADPNVAIVTSIGPILSAYDSLPASLSISDAAQQISAAAVQAAAANTPNS
jgi:hypothetical protein